MPTLTLGLVISTFARTQFQAFQLAFFTMLPSILLSGFMFPFRGMPPWAQSLGEALPLTHFLRIVRGLILKGATAAQMSEELAVLALMLAGMDGGLVTGALLADRYAVSRSRMLLGDAGALAGGVAGFTGGWTDDLLMRLSDLKLTVPGLIMAMAVAAALGPGIFNMVVAISVVVARLCAPGARRGDRAQGRFVRDRRARDRRSARAALAGAHPAQCDDAGHREDVAGHGLCHRRSRRHPRR